MEEEAYDVVANYANAEKIVTKKEYYVDENGKINMCTAIKELMKDSEVDGFIKALQTMGQNDDDIIESVKGLNDRVYALCTYTGMINLRKTLYQKGFAKELWK